ncbi:MAG: STAS domain-containing protein [Desulfovibrio sp.]|uniref:STAS domain-containing protein n=1 Tax=Desulfovibrio sp. 7SRBS1 TaxID=3378064 RepID=UPI003B3F7501
MDIQEKTDDGILVLSISGRLDSATSPVFEENLLGKIKAGNTRLVLDFGPLEYISSAGLRVLLKATRELKTTGGIMVICSVRDYIQEVFDLSGFSSVFTMTGTLEDAQAAC